MATNTAGPSLASTAELVEDILLRLPLDEILHAQRVNKTWRDFINNSPKLQKALFFKPCTEYQLNLVRDEAPNDEDQECLVKSCRGDYECRCHAQGELEEKYAWPLRWAVDELGYSEQGPVLNPFIWTHLPWLNDHMADPLSNVPSSFRYPEASWRKMLCTQPPLSEAVVDFDAYTTHYHVAFPNTNQDGVTLGRLQEGADGFDHCAEFQRDLVFRHVMKENGTTRSECTAARVFDSISPVEEDVRPNGRNAILVIPKGNSESA